MDSLRWSERKKPAPSGTSTWSQSKSTANLYKAPPGTSVWGPFLTAKPDIPENNLKGNNNNNLNPVKPANPANSVQQILDTRADIGIEERLAFMALTSIEIIEISRNYNMSYDSLALNNNVLDSTNIVNAYSPLKILNLGVANGDFVNNLPIVTTGTNTNIVQSTGDINIVVPSSALPSIPIPNSSTTSSTTSSVTKVRVQFGSGGKIDRMQY